MAIRNFLLLLKRFNFLFVLPIFVSCQTAPKPVARPAEPKTEVYTTTKTGVVEEPQPLAATEDEPEVNQEPPAQELTRLGVILGPGGFATFSQIGFLQGLHKSKVRIDFVAGIEFGALVAGLYAKKGQAFDVEWQMMKMDPDKLIQTTLLSSQYRPQKVNVLFPFLKEFFQSSSVESAKVPFVCPAFSLSKQAVFFMNKGSFSDLLPFCIPVYPYFEPYQDSVASVLSTKVLTDYLRAKGITKIVYVNVLPTKQMMKMKGVDPQVETFWNLLSHQLTKQLDGVDFFVQIPLSESAYMSSSSRREFIRQGLVAGQQFGEVLMTKIKQ
jgi:hypothetical protein